MEKHLFLSFLSLFELILLDVIVSTGVVLGLGSVLIVKEVALAVGQIIGHSSVKSDARMKKVKQLNLLVETGFSVNGPFAQVGQLLQKAPKITLSNISPFINDTFFTELSMEK